MAALRAVKQGTLVTPQKTFQGAPTCSTLRAQIGRARSSELTSKQLRSAHIHEGVEGAILCAARACQRSASANRGGECLALVVCSGWRATAGRTSPKAIQITIKWTD